MAASKTDPLSELTRAVPPPEGATRVNWRDVEDQLGFPLPPDFRSVTDVYGEGIFDDFLWLLHPTSANPHRNLVRQLQVQRETLAAIELYEGPPPEDLVPWAMSGNGDVCYWKLDSDPQRLPGRVIAVNEGRGPEWAEYSMSATEWLLAVLTGRISVPVFPRDFPSSNPTFESLQ